MSIIEKGRAELEQREADRIAREEAWRESNRRHTAWWFRFVFLTRRDSEPELEDWHTIGEGDTRAPSEFTVEGVRYRVRWEFQGTGGDRAYWDDGWWPEWFVVVRRPFRWFPLLWHEVEVGVWGAGAVAAAVAFGDEQHAWSMLDLLALAAIAAAVSIVVTGLLYLSAGMLPW